MATRTLAIVDYGPSMLSLPPVRVGTLTLDERGEVRAEFVPDARGAEAREFVERKGGVEHGEVLRLRDGRVFFDACARAPWFLGAYVTEPADVDASGRV
jgi:hypothetical protein